MSKTIIIKGQPFRDFMPKTRAFAERGNIIVGQEAVNFFRSSFRNQGFTRNTLIPWRRTKSGKGNTFSKKSSGILIRSGRLMRSIYVSYRSLTKVVVSAPVPYAQVHNEGFQGTVSVRAHSRRNFMKVKVTGGSNARKRKTQTLEILKSNGMVRAHSRKMNMPRRQFMGESPALDKILQIELDKLAQLTFK